MTSLTVVYSQLSETLRGSHVQNASSDSYGTLCHFLMWQVLNSAVPRSTLLIASINMDKHDSKRQLRLRNGLVTRHAYRLALDASLEEI